jgi:hypothetical protein
MGASTIPSSRRHLVEMVRSAYTKLEDELAAAGPRAGGLPCVDDWTVKDLLAVRAWWTESVVRWIRVGRDTDSLDLPAPGYAWRETPRLNADIVEAARSQSYDEILARLRDGYAEVLATIDGLDDRELLEAGVFAWAGKYPLSRWLSLNTARQYKTARTFIRRALRPAG